MGGAYILATVQQKGYLRDVYHKCYSLQETTLTYTDYLTAKGNNFRKKDETRAYMAQIKFFYLQYSNITEISDVVIRSMLNSLKYLRIFHNKINVLPKGITQAGNITELWISSNPYECNCDMMWMGDWLVKATNIMDKENVTCTTSKMKAIALHQYLL